MLIGRAGRPDDRPGGQGPVFPEGPVLTAPTPVVAAVSRAAGAGGAAAARCNGPFDPATAAGSARWPTSAPRRVARSACACPACSLSGEPRSRTPAAAMGAACPGGSSSRAMTCRCCWSASVISWRCSDRLEPAGERWLLWIEVQMAGSADVAQSEQPAPEPI